MFTDCFETLPVLVHGLNMRMLFRAIFALMFTPVKPSFDLFVYALFSSVVHNVCAQVVLVLSYIAFRSGN